MILRNQEKLYEGIQEYFDAQDDRDFVRSRRLPDNLSWLRRLALTLLKQHPAKQSIAMKRRIADWNADFLMQVHTGIKT